MKINKILLLLIIMFFITGCGMSNEKRIEVLKKCKEEKLGVSYSLIGYEPMCTSPSGSEYFRIRCEELGGLTTIQNGEYKCDKIIN